MDVTNVTRTPCVLPNHSRSAYLWCIVNASGNPDWATVAETKRGAWEKAYHNAEQHAGMDLGEWRTYMQEHADNKAVTFFCQF